MLQVVTCDVTIGALRGTLQSSPRQRYPCDQHALTAPRIVVDVEDGDLDTVNVQPIRCSQGQQLRQRDLAGRNGRSGIIEQDHRAIALRNLANELFLSTTNRTAADDRLLADSARRAPAGIAANGDVLAVDKR
jgi:hypothetical protein